MALSLSNLFNSEMKLLILSSSTGGGHDMRAKALAEWVGPKKLETRTLRPIDENSHVYNAGVKLYNFIQKYAPKLHFFYFHFLEHANLHRDHRKILGKRKFIREIKQFNPNLIISMHAHLNHAYFNLAKKFLGEKVNFVVYCGELSGGSGFSRHWINPRVDLLITPTEESRQFSITRGMPASKVKNCGLLLRKPFYRSANFDRDSERLLKIGIKEGESFLLLATGANGANKHKKICKYLCKKNYSSTIVALCGESESFRKSLTEISLPSRTRIIALPKQSADEMASLMKRAVCCVGRPGAGLTSEALACGTPMIFELINGAMPQEINNLNFWKKKCGRLNSIKSPKELYLLLQKNSPSLKFKMPGSPEKILKELDLMINRG